MIAPQAEPEDVLPQRQPSEPPSQEELMAGTDSQLQNMLAIQTRFQARLLQIQASMDNAIQRMEGNVNLQKSKIVGLEAALQVCNKERDKLEKQLEDSGNSNTQLQNQLQACNTERQSLERQLADSENSNRQLQNELQACNTKRQSLERQLADSENSNRQLQMELDKITAEKVKIEEERDENLNRLHETIRKMEDNETDFTKYKSDLLTKLSVNNDYIDGVLNDTINELTETSRKITAVDNNLTNFLMARDSHFGYSDILNIENTTEMFNDTDKMNLFGQKNDYSENFETESINNDLNRFGKTDVYGSESNESKGSDGSDGSNGSDSESSFGSVSDSDSDSDSGSAPGTESDSE